MNAWTRFYRQESDYMLAEKDCFDGNSSIVYTSGRMEHCHLDQTTYTGKNSIVSKSLLILLLKVI